MPTNECKMRVGGGGGRYGVGGGAGYTFLFFITHVYCNCLRGKQKAFLVYFALNFINLHIEMVLEINARIMLHW